MAEKKKFDISAAVIKQLGEDLITDEVTALIELVKNAYDADATYASVVVDTNNFVPEPRVFFTEEKLSSEQSVPELDELIHTDSLLVSEDLLSSNIEKTQKKGVQLGYITIEDDGTGMGRKEIDKGWLTISLSLKRQMKISGKVTPKKSRTPLGDKGLGRLSTQRLGYRLEMFTSKEFVRTDGDQAEYEEYCKNDKDFEYHVAFDWSDFKEDVSLNAVPIHFDSDKKENSRKGTKLIITNLRNPDVWLGDNQKKLITGLAQLIFPFGKSRPFSVFLTINGVRCDLETISDNLRKVALAQFSFKFDGRKLVVGGKIKLTKLRGNDSESFEKLLAPDQGNDFYAFLTNPQNNRNLPGIKFLSEADGFVSFEKSLDVKSLKLETVNGEIANPGKFDGEIDEFALRGIDLDPFGDVFSKVADYSDFVSQQSGVRIFRDGFGIRPYGFFSDDNKVNDWLGLSSAQTSGRSFYGIRPKNVIGYVALSAKDNKQLQEKTDREGFIETLYSTNFFRIMEHVIHTINIDVYNNLRRAYNEYKKEKAEASVNFISSTQSFNKMRKISVDTKMIDNQLQELEPRVISANKRVSEIVTRIENEPLFATPQEREFSPLLKEVNDTLAQVKHLIEQTQTLLNHAKNLGDAANALQSKLDILEEQITDFSELAGLGLTAEALSHEIHTIADRLAERTRILNENLKRKKSVDSDVIAYIEYIHSAISTLRKQLSHLAPSLRYVRERLDEIQLDSFFLEIKEHYISRLSEPRVQIELIGLENSFSIKMNKGKLTQVIDNIVLNAEYWLKEAVKREDINIPIITITLKKPYILIEDNGYGIDPSVELSMFQPFVTTKPKSEGRGLGLFIVQELLNASDCTINLKHERNQFERRYVFQIDLSGVLHG